MMKIPTQCFWHNLALNVIILQKQKTLFQNWVRAWREYQRWWFGGWNMMETVSGGLLAATKCNGLHLFLLENMVTYFVETLVWYLHSFLHNMENVPISKSKVGNLLCLQRTLVDIVFTFVCIRVSSFMYFVDLHF